MVIRLSGDLDIEGLQKTLKYLRYREIGAKSNATQQDADSLANHVKKGWWEKIEAGFKA